jgi:hypothetical protein
MARFNLPVLVLAVMWWLIETSYFGWNALPGSMPELFADGLAIALAGAAFLLTLERKRFVAHACVADPGPPTAEPETAAQVTSPSAFVSRQAKWSQTASLLDELGQPGMAMSARGFATIERHVQEKQASKLVPLRSLPTIGAEPRETR